MRVLSKTLTLAAATTALLSACEPTKAPAPPATTPAPPKQAEPLAQAKQDALEFYRSQPPYLRPREFSETPDGLSTMKAEACGACHQEIYKEWALSTHRRAWLDDAQFQKELEKSRGAHGPKDKPKSDVGWMCVNCHTPMMNQQPEWVVGLEGDKRDRPKYAKNPTYDRGFEEDAITCATCHVRDGVVYGPYGDTKAPHPTAKDERLLDERVCTDCHQATAQFPELSLGCFFTTGQEFEQYKSREQADASVQSCQSCHMPHVERKLAERFDVPVRKTRRHWFGGSLIPKKPQYQDELAPLIEVYGSGASFEIAWTEAADSKSNPKHCPEITVKMTNTYAGHSLPTGDPERHIIFEAALVSKAGAPLERAESFIGDRYKWWPKIERVEEARLKPGESRALTLKTPCDQEELVVEVNAHKYRMHKEAYDYHKLEGDYVRGRQFYEAKWRMVRGQAPQKLHERREIPASATSADAAAQP